MPSSLWNPILRWMLRSTVKANIINCLFCSDFLGLIHFILPYKTYFLLSLVNVISFSESQLSILTFPVFVFETKSSVYGLEFGLTPGQNRRIGESETK